MLIRLAMAAAARHGISPFMLSARAWCRAFDTPMSLLAIILDGALCNRRMSAVQSVYVAHFNSAAYTGQRRSPCIPLGGLGSLSE